jgi:hypothetical protein
VGAGGGKNQTHSLSLSLSLFSEIGGAAIGEGIHRRRNCNYQKAQKIQIHTTHSLSLFASEFNSMLVESRFCFYYCCQQPKKMQQKKRDLEQCSRARHDGIRTDRQKKKEKKGR